MIIWIASYPKSGNTWVRAVLTSMLYSDDGNFNFKNLGKINQYPLKKHFKYFTKKFEKQDEIMKYWIASQERLNLDKKVKFLKTHNANCKLAGYPFTNKDNTLATIYIVRDPRNIITSMCNHFTMTYEESRDFMFDTASTILDVETTSTILGSWSDHYNSWVKNNDNLLVIKYEDLISNTRKEFDKILNFIKKYKNFEINENKITNAIKSTSFENLQKLEQTTSFMEAPKNKKSEEKVKFFNLGKKNKWEKLLDSKLKIEIEKKFFKELNEIGYLN